MRPVWVCFATSVVLHSLIFVVRRDRPPVPFAAHEDRRSYTQVELLEAAPVKIVETSKPVLAEPAKPEESFPRPRQKPVTERLRPISKAIVAEAKEVQTASLAAQPTEQPQVISSPASAEVFAIQNPKPKYPNSARRLRQEGVVVLSVKVSAEGLPLSVAVQKSSGFEALDESAVDTVKHWRFQAALRGGVAVESVVSLPVRFELHS